MSFDTGGKKGGVRSDINITPLVDVVLVLLIIFMVATPIMLKQIDVDVPQKADVEPSPAPPTSEQMVLQISKAGNVAINHEPVNVDGLGERLKTLLQNRREKVIFFDVDEDANYGDVIHIMDIARGAGAKTLGIMTKS